MRCRSSTLVLKADVDTLALILVGTAHLLLAGRHGTPAQADQLPKIANTIIAGSEAETNRVSLKR
jgi:hypothetical protein